MQEEQDLLSLGKKIWEKGPDSSGCKKQSTVLSPGCICPACTGVYTHKTKPNKKPAMRMQKLLGEMRYHFAILWEFRIHHGKFEAAISTFGNGDMGCTGNVDLPMPHVKNLKCLMSKFMKSL